MAMMMRAMVIAVSRGCQGDNPTNRRRCQRQKVGTHIFYCSRIVRLAGFGTQPLAEQNQIGVGMGKFAESGDDAHGYAAVFLALIGFIISACHL